VRPGDAAHLVEHGLGVGHEVEAVRLPDDVERAEPGKVAHVAVLEAGGEPVVVRGELVALQLRLGDVDDGHASAEQTECGALLPPAATQTEHVGALQLTEDAAGVDRVEGLGGVEVEERTGVLAAGAGQLRPALGVEAGEIVHAVR
jgi:hypothetical protein